MFPLPAQFSDSVVSDVVDRLVEGGPDIRSRNIVVMVYFLLLPLNE